ncbi:MAG TPA: glycine cleavage system aminomethyltransferase GcvT [Mycobacteriales bacterium]|jgi:aminomethyltransferase|nr:glycine cleavage system aminomethyltransferase GcvT [Mycobacteriales bacterium]
MDATEGPTGRHSPLHAEHEALDASFGEFSGWLMPLQYPAGVLAEHASVRERVGIFDVSHLGTVRVAGAGAADYLNRCLTNDLDRIGPGRAQYTLACNDSGGVVDDLIVYCSNREDLLCAPNAANAETVADLLAVGAPASVTVENLHGEFAIIAVQGPRSAAVLRSVGFPTPSAYMTFEQPDDPAMAGRLMVCRSGYTGELGYELMMWREGAAEVWRRLLTAVKAEDGLPCGLAARDTLRTEMGYPLHGHELSTEITPGEAGLNWAVGWKKPEFWGREALLAQRRRGPEWVSRGLVLPRGSVPRPGMAVFDGTAPVGEVTSGTFSPTLRTPIALARIRSAADAETLSVEARGRRLPATVTAPPFVVTNGLR